MADLAHCGNFISNLRLCKTGADNVRSAIAVKKAKQDQGIQTHLPANNSPCNNSMCVDPSCKFFHCSGVVFNLFIPDVHGPDKSKISTGLDWS